MPDRPKDYEAKNPPPNGCKVCGVDEYDHAHRWHPMTGYHEWIEPTDRQRLSRMLDRRAARLYSAKVDADIRARAHPIRQQYLNGLIVMDPKAVLRVSGI